MTKKLLPSFEKITQMLEAADLYTNASETHGILSGLVCGGLKLDDQSWRTHFNDIVNDGMGLPSSVNKLVESIYGQVLNQITDDGLGFKLLLPDSDVPLDERAEAMAQWSQGFLVGFGMVQQALNQAANEIQELIRDIRDISNISLNFEQEDEESEIAFDEIEEYLRIGAMLCFNTFSRKTATPVSKTLH